MLTEIASKTSQHIIIRSFKSVFLPCLIYQLGCCSVGVSTKNVVLSTGCGTW